MQTTAHQPLLSTKHHPRTPTRTNASASATSPSSMSGGASNLTSGSMMMSGGGVQLQPSSFSSALSSHPLMQRPHVDHQPVATASSTAPAFPSMTSSSLSSLSVPSTSSSSSSSSLSVSAPSSAAKKRSSAQFDASQHAAKHTRADSDDEEEETQPPLAQADDDEEEEMGGMESTATQLTAIRRSAPRAAAGEKAVFANRDEEDTSFMTLLNRLTNLEFPDRLNTEEQCPLCPEKFPLEVFADHVYRCIQKLDGQERIEQERLDAKYASRIAYIEGVPVRMRGHRARRSADRMESDDGEEEEEDSQSPYASPSPPPIDGFAETERRLLDRYANTKHDICPQGKSCTRTDAQHFKLKFHPLVSCPICDDEYPVYEINAHVTICLDTPRPAAPVAKTDSNMADASHTAEPSPTAAAVAANFPAFSSAPIPLPSTSSSAASLTSSTSGARRHPRRSAPRSVSASAMDGGNGNASHLQPDLLTPPLGLEDDDAIADDEADEEEERGKTSASAPHLPGPSPSHQRSTSDSCSLSLVQAAAMANLVLNKHSKNKGGAAVSGSASSGSSSNSGGVSGEKDPSLADLLSTFSTLGFTRERLERQVAEHEAKANQQSTNKQQQQQ